MIKVLGELLYRLVTIVFSGMVSFIVLAEIMNVVDQNSWYFTLAFFGAMAASIITFFLALHWSWKFYGIKPLI